MPSDPRDKRSAGAAVDRLSSSASSLDWPPKKAAKENAPAKSNVTAEVNASAEANLCDRQKSVRAIEVYAREVYAKIVDAIQVYAIQVYAIQVYAIEVCAIDEWARKVADKSMPASQFRSESTRRWFSLIAHRSAISSLCNCARHQRADNAPLERQDRARHCDAAVAHDARTSGLRGYFIV